MMNNREYIVKYEKLPPAFVELLGPHYPDAGWLPLFRFRLAGVPLKIAQIDVYQQEWKALAKLGTVYLDVEFISTTNTTGFVSILIHELVHVWRFKRAGAVVQAIDWTSTRIRSWWNGSPYLHSKSREETLATEYTDRIWNELCLTWESWRQLLDMEV